MAKIQTRRTIGFRGEVVLRIHRHARRIGEPAAAWAEGVLTRALDEAEAPQVSRSEWLDELKMRAADRAHQFAERAAQNDSSTRFAGGAE